MKNNIKNIIKSRRSIRKFKNIPIAKKDLEDLIEAGSFAPTGSNTQCYRFIVTTNKQDIQTIRKLRGYWFKTCQAIIICFADKKNYPVKSKLLIHLPYWDCGASIQNILLLAEEKKIGTCWVSMHPKLKCMEFINKTFKIPKDYEVMGAIALGYSDEIINYKTATHGTRFIKRKPIKYYIWKWRE